MPNPKKADVFVVLDTEHPTLKFHLESTDLPIGPDGELYFKNCGHPGFDVYFHLKDPKNLGYRFPLDEDAAVSSQVGRGVCPTEASVHQVFKPKAVTNGQKTLCVKNANKKQEEFGYTLWVSKDGNPPYKDLDPGGFNQNGPESLAASNVLVAFGGAVAGALLTLGAEALMNR